MLLTVSKRLEFSASRRLFVKEWAEAENLATFGPETSAQYGTGRNYVAYFIFSGEVDPRTGMLMNISEIKERVGRVLRDGFDHKFLNADNKAFMTVPPTTENIARQLFVDAAPLFGATSAKLVACHLSESEARSATYFETGVSESNYWFEFSAARQTTSPRLTTEENKKLFGVAASPFGHGHNYRARLTFREQQRSSDLPLVSFSEIQSCLGSLRKELDHKNLNHEVLALIDQPITTENLARHIHERVREKLRINRVRLHERDDFFAEYWSRGKYFLGLQIPFNAAHRLQSGNLTGEENVALYGKCNNPLGHGHCYLTEATIGGEFDERSGALIDLAGFQAAIAEAVQPWQDRHLDLEMAEFREKPSTGENIVQALWPRFDTRLNGRLVRLRLWETVNNRFTLRKSRSDARCNEGRVGRWTLDVGRWKADVHLEHMKRYLITGASRGIGRAIAEKLAGAEHTLLLHGRDREALAKTCSLVENRSGHTIPLHYDLRHADSVAQMVDEIGSAPIDALINNAGIAVVKPFGEITLEEWETIFAVNVTAPFLLTQRLAPNMVSGSSIVNILSIAAKTGFPGWSSYSMSKFALEGFSQAVREEVRSSGIRVLNIYPAATNTEIWNAVGGEWPRDKMMLPEEIAEAVAYALSRPAEVAVENIDLTNLTGRL